MVDVTVGTDNGRKVITFYCGEVAYSLKDEYGTWVGYPNVHDNEDADLLRAIMDKLADEVEVKC